MAYIYNDPTFGDVDLTTVDIVGPGFYNLVGGATGSGRNNFFNQVLRGYDANLGAGEFMFAKSSGTIAAGTVVEFVDTLTAGAVVRTFQAWAGTVGTGKTLGVTLIATTINQFCWIQVGGNAITTVQGAPVAGNSVYWQASGVVSPTLVASKQVLNAQFATAPAVTIGSGSAAVVLSATQAIVYLNRAVAQSQIT